MSYQEKRTWIYLVCSAAAYGVYLVIVVPRLLHTPVSHVPYVGTLFATSVASIVAVVVGTTMFGGARSREDRRSDVRDKETYRFGEYMSRWFVIAAATCALLMAMARWEYFWIANTIYLGFVLAAVAGSVVALVAYRRGLQPR